MEKPSYNKPQVKKVSFDKESVKNKEVFINEIPVSQRAAIATFSRMSDEDLEHMKFSKGDKEVFRKKTRELWKEIAVHGILRKDKKTGRPQLLNFSDLDGQTCIGLLELAKINVEDIKYVKPGEFVPGRVNFDTGNRYGFIVEDQGKTVFLDHHGPHGENGLSAAKITYEALLNMGLLKKEKYLDELVNFVTQMDNKTFPDAPKYFADSYQTLLGLYRFVKLPELLQFFKDGKKPTDILTDEELKKYGFIYKDNTGKNFNRSTEQKKIVEQSFAQMLKIDKAGFIVPSERYGHIIIDVGKSIKGGFDAVQAYHGNTYIIWDSNQESFFIGTDKKITDDFKQGIKVRETMWIKPVDDGMPLKITLGEILRIMTDNNLQPKEKLAQFLEEEEGERQTAELNK